MTIDNLTCPHCGKPGMDSLHISVCVQAQEVARLTQAFQAMKRDIAAIIDQRERTPGNIAQERR